MLPFDPIAERDFWLETRLKYAIESKPPTSDEHTPPSVAHFARVSYSAGRTNEFVNGYLVGLSKELRRRVDKHLAWMESESEPNLVIYTGQGFTYEGWLDSVHEWRQALGLCKWLCRGSRTFSDLTSAAAADWQVLELASIKRAPVVATTWTTILHWHSRPMRR